MSKQGKEQKYDSTKDTQQHIKIVKYYLDRCCLFIKKLSIVHDQSKLNPPEKTIFDIYTEKLNHTTYGSNRYKNNLKNMKIALDHHYTHNSHHPEFYKDGIMGMNLLTLIEMLADWKAASLRHSDGDINKSLIINQERFGYGDELKQIFQNTIKLFDDFDMEE